MSKTRKFLGFWIILVLLCLLFASFYIASRLLDKLFGFNVQRGTLEAFLGAICILAGAFWVSWAYSYLHYEGKGSPLEIFGRALYPTQNLVTTGPYAYTRNPVVLGLLFGMVGTAFFMSSTSGLILVPVAAVGALLYIKWFEEPALERRFGDEYREYLGRVPILVPRLRYR